MTQIRLSQALHLMTSTKTKSIAFTADLHHKTQKADLVNGMVRTYQRLNDEGAQHPPESKRVQLIIADAFKAVVQSTIEYCDTMATRDYGNTVAKADVVYNGTVVIKDAPPTLLMFLRKQIQDLRTFTEKAVVLDQSREWKLDTQTNLWKTDAVLTESTAKVQGALTLVAPTDKHPGQAVQITKDIPVGTWSTVQFSGAIPHSRRLELLERIDAMGKAVEEALNECNAIKVERKDVCAPLFAALLA